MKLQNESVTIELKNGYIINGTVASISPQMNTALRNVKMTPKTAQFGSKAAAPETVSIDQMNIRGNTIRYIILPDSLPLETMLVDDMPKPKNKARKETEQSRGRGGRGGRGRGGRGGGGGGGRGRGRGRGF